MPIRPTWDACIDLTPASCGSAWLQCAHLVQDVADAVRGIAGAGAIDVELHSHAPAHLPWLILYRAGSAVPLTAPDWDNLRSRVEHAVRDATGIR